MSSFGVVLDTAALFPASLRDILLRNAASGLYRLSWSEDIMEELRRNLIKQGATTEEGAARLLAKINEYFQDAMVLRPGYQELVPSMKNHRKDRHVLALAVVTHSQVIVTPNLKDFPKKALEPYNIEAQAPDIFLMYQLDLNQEQVLENIKQQALDLKNPPKTVEDILDALSLHASKFVERVRSTLLHTGM